MKKIFFIFCILCWIAWAQSSVAQEYITFNNEEKSLLEYLVTANLTEFGGVIDYENQHNQNGTFVQIPVLEDNIVKNEEILESQIENSSEKFFLHNSISKVVKDVYKIQVEQTDTIRPLLKDYLSFDFEKGPLENLHIWSAYQMNFSETLPESGENLSKFDIGVINVLIDGKFSGGKENFRVMLDPSHRSSHPNFMQTFFQDLYVESSRIPHTKVLLGNSRPGVGIEGAQSPYTLDFINRAQIARNLSNARKFGLRVRGDYSLLDYDTGIYSSCTNFTDFFPGHEFDAWVNIKPLGKTDGKYGKLVTGSGLQSGVKHGTSYYMTGAYVGYDFKKFKTKFEYARANGSNGASGLTSKHSQGLFWTVGYKLTKKLEILARYDQFQPDRYINNNHRKEYVLGANYYLKGQALKLIFNYIYCDYNSNVNTHRLMMGTQIIL